MSSFRAVKCHYYVADTLHEAIFEAKDPTTFAYLSPRQLALCQNYSAACSITLGPNLLESASLRLQLHPVLSVTMTSLNVHQVD